MIGHVTKILRDKGYAFVRDEDGNSRFLHARDMVDPIFFDQLFVGQQVEFIPLELESAGGNRLRATEARPV